jgi:predicted deacylase
MSEGRGIIQGVVLLVLLAIFVAWAGVKFHESRVPEPLYPAHGLTSIRHLSDYFAGVKGTRGDTEVYVFDGSHPGGTVLVFGGTHPNEAAGYIAATVLLENIRVVQGRALVIPRANNSGFTHTEAGEAFPQFYEIPTPDGTRRFRYGSRFTNPLDQWPDPEVYLHYPSKQELSGGETRNLNRNYPGRASGTFTERVTHAITELVKAEHVDLVIDLHEASPEYPVINAIIAHERAMDVAAMANLTLQSQGLLYSLEPSPTNFHGLTHRELGDATNAMCVLMESANPVQGRLRGRMEPEKVVTGIDQCYLKAARAGLLHVPYDSTGSPMSVRVGRHLAGIRALLESYTLLQPDRPLVVAGIPEYEDLQRRGLGEFLRPKSD